MAVEVGAVVVAAVVVVAVVVDENCCFCSPLSSKPSIFLLCDEKF